jgi:hypothetical protein
VAIPARDEAGAIGATLAALARQTDLAGRALEPERYEVLVLANNCVDATASVAREFGARRPWLRLHVLEVTLPDDCAHVGWARRLVMDEACRRLTSLGRPRGVIATTDADSCPAPDWLAATLDELARGADAVGGRITLDRASLLALDPLTRAYHVRDLGYRQLLTEIEAYLDPDPADPWPRHCQHFGASLAVTAETYARAGGLPAEPWLEDIAFYHALLRIDARLRHSPAVRVLTSARGAGRTGFGFAVHLNQLHELGRAGRPFLVEPPAAFEARVRLRAQLRASWGRGRLAPGLAARLGVESDWLAGELGASAFGALWERVEQRAARPDIALCDVRVALGLARSRLAELRPVARLADAALVEVEPILLFAPAEETA